MKKELVINPISYFNGTINLPGSKIISNRVLLLSAQAKGTTKIINLLNSYDTKLVLSALENLGINYHLYKNGNICEVEGCNS